MYQLRQTDVFNKWLAALRDRRAKARILSRLDSAQLGNLGDTKSLSGGVYEMRVHTGPGYRLYYYKRQQMVILLLCGGDKSSQSRDVQRARKLAQELEMD